MKKSFFKQRDKQKHIAVSVLISSCVSAISALYYENTIYYTLVAVLLFILLVSFLKEVVYDFYLGKGTPDVMDVVANTVGFILGFIIVQLGIYLICTMY